MLEELYIDRYRHFYNCTVSFSAVQIITGRNGTGKTAIIELLAKLRYFLEGRDNVATQSFTVSDVCSANDIPRWDVKEHGKYTTTIGFKHTGNTHGGFEYDVKKGMRVIMSYPV